MKDTKDHLMLLVNNEVDLIEGLTDNEVGDYIADAYEVEHTITSEGTYLGSSLLTAGGGPTIWVDTRDGIVRGYYGNDTIERSFISNQTLSSMLEEMYNQIG